VGAFYKKSEKFASQIGKLVGRLLALSKYLASQVVEKTNPRPVKNSFLLLFLPFFVSKMRLKTAICA
jgi:hypothetical protein